MKFPVILLLFSSLVYSIDFYPSVTLKRYHSDSILIDARIVSDDTVWSESVPYLLKVNGKPVYSAKADCNENHVFGLYSLANNKFSIEFTVDPDNKVNESNESNNTLVREIDAHSFSIPDYSISYSAKYTFGNNTAEAGFYLSADNNATDSVIYVVTVNDSIVRRKKVKPNITILVDIPFKSYSDVKVQIDPDSLLNDFERNNNYIDQKFFQDTILAEGLIDLWPTIIFQMTTVNGLEYQIVTNTNCNCDNCSVFDWKGFSLNVPSTFNFGLAMTEPRIFDINVDDKNIIKESNEHNNRLKAIVLPPDYFDNSISIKRKSNVLVCHKPVPDKFDLLGRIIANQTSVNTNGLIIRKYDNFNKKEIQIK